MTTFDHRPGVRFRARPSFAAWSSRCLTSAPGYEVRRGGRQFRRRLVRAAPDDLILAIGRAANSRPPRWLSFARAVKQDDGAITRIRETLAAAKVSSEERFQRAFAAALQKASNVAGGADDLPLHGAAGAVIGKAVFGRSEVKLRVQAAQGAAFADFIREELPGLMKRFAAQSEGA